NIIEILPIITGAEMPHAVGRLATIYEDVRNALKKSEMLQLPYTLVIDSAWIGEETEVKNEEQFADLPIPKRHKKNVRLHSMAYHRDVQRHVVCPIFAEYQREV